MEYEIWDERKFLGMIATVRPKQNYFLDLMFGFEILSENEYIDFAKIPSPGRVVAPYVMPMAEGRPVFEMQERAGRFKPAYVKVKDAIVPLDGVVKIAGIGEPLFNPAKLSIPQRRELMRLAINTQHMESIRTRHELMAAQAVIDGGYVVSGEDYPAQTLTFGRNAGQTIVKLAGTRWGDPGVSILDDIQTWVDTMTDAEFGALPNRITMGRPVWGVVRKDEEMLKHMDINIRGGAVTIERGLTAAAPEEAKSYKVGELMLGGGSGHVIELWVNYEKYQPKRGAAEVPFLAQNKIVMTGTKSAYQGYRCFGTIVDPEHEYASLPISGRNWRQVGDPTVEYMLHQSSPLMVPLNPNASLSAEVIAPV